MVWEPAGGAGGGAGPAGGLPGQAGGAGGRDGGDATAVEVGTRQQVRTSRDVFVCNFLSKPFLLLYSW